MNKTITGYSLLIFFLNSCTIEIKQDKSAGEDGTKSPNSGFICPMDCENGKIYNEKVNCPICGMELEIYKNSK